MLVLSFAGITWGVMSTSWDEEEEGSLLGIEQVSKNVALMRGDLATSRGQVESYYAEKDAADDGVYMTKAAAEKAKKKRD